MEKYLIKLFLDIKFLFPCFFSIKTATKRAMTQNIIQSDEFLIYSHHEPPLPKVQNWPTEFWSFLIILISSAPSIPRRILINPQNIDNQVLLYSATPTHSSYPTGMHSSHITFCDERISNVNVTNSHFLLWHALSLIKDYLIGSRRRWFFLLILWIVSISANSCRVEFITSYRVG